MNLKNVFLSMFLMSFALISYACEVDMLAQEISEQLMVKEERLKELGAKITEHEELVSVIMKKIFDLRQVYFGKMKEKLTKQTLKDDISSSEADDIDNFISCELRDFIEIFFKKLDSEKKPQESVLVELFYRHLNDDGDASGALLKFNAIRGIIEMFVLTHLMSEWEDCLREINNISKLEKINK